MPIARRIRAAEGFTRHRGRRIERAMTSAHTMLIIRPAFGTGARGI